MAEEQNAIEGWVADMTQRLEGYVDEERVWAAGEASPTLTVRSPMPEVPGDDEGSFTSITEILRFEKVLARGGMGEIHVAKQPSIPPHVTWLLYPPKPKVPHSP